MKRISNFIVDILPFITIFGLIFLFFKNIANPGFLKANLVQILTLLIAVAISYFSSQKKADQRVRKQHAESIIEKLQVLVNSDYFFHISATGDCDDVKKELKKRIQTTNRRVSNYIAVLEEYGKNLKFADDAEYIKGEFKQYRELVDEHLDDIDYLAKSEITLKKYADNISNKCDRIVLNLYK